MSISTSPRPSQSKLQAPWSLPLLSGILSCAVSLTQAVETPKSYGAPSSYEHAVVRVPMTEQAPTIDGVIENGEWEDATGVSGFWYDFSLAHPRFLASHHTQPRVYLSYDKDNFYVCFDNPVYPHNSWLKARGRFPDVLHHPQYGLLWDDHVEFELRPYPENTKGFNLGLLRWDVNAISNFVDWCWTKEGGDDRSWQSNAEISTKVGDKRWIIEMAIPFESLRYAGYAGTDDNGEPYVKIPPPDGTVYRFWFHEGIGGCGTYSLHFDKHNFMVTEGEFIFDSKAPSFQINELGELMDDVINLELSVKNHSSRSETVRLGFFVENPAGNIYSSYNSDELSDGLLELRPGEVRTIRLRQPFPGISRDGNVLWFDVRSAGKPAKILYRTRLQDFHGMDGGRVLVGERLVSYPERRLEPIDDMRPGREDFRLIWDYTPVTQKVSCIMDTDVHGASEEAQSAVEAKVTVEENIPDGKVLAEQTVPFNGPFAVATLQLPKDLEDGLEMKMTTILFDENKRIMGERSVATTGSSKRPKPWVYLNPEWLDNEIGLEDRVWEPFTPIEKTDDGFATLKHTFAIADSGLPEQIRIKPDPRELPFDKRGDDAELSDDFLIRYGRGPQLAAPMRFEGVVDGERVQAEVVKSAELVRQWKSEFEYKSTIRVGTVLLEVKTVYDCDGTLDVYLDYGPEGNAARIDRLELVTEFAGPLDLLASGTRAGMAGSDVFECSIPQKEGVVWDSTDTDIELFYSKFVPWFWIGTGDRAFTWTCNSDRGWHLDKEGASMQVERDAEGQTTWRVAFINHPVTVRESKSTWFGLLVHPAKPKPEDY
ncbi:MAG: glycoside hydrolase domain-containing protein, partial [Verrucomicrobiota bacterium]